MQLKKIIIPIIQRDYAQGRKGSDVTRVRGRFLESLYKAVTEKPITLDFVYGDIDDEGNMTPLDGQQRLTTLFLLHWYAAKKGNISEENYEFLKKFSYETRYSARYFCIDLVDYKPEFKTAISKEIVNQAWFPLDWENDPTISSMLVMLDAIDDKFKNVTDLWDKLKENCVTFYFLPIKDMGLTDELYIKMKEHNIWGRRYFYPLISTFSTYRGLESAKPENLPIATEMANKVICLPMHHALKENDIERILKLIMNNG